MSDAKGPGAWDIPLHSMPTHAPSAPRTRSGSASLSFARSPMLAPASSIPTHMRQVSTASIPLERIDDASFDSDRSAPTAYTKTGNDTYNEEDELDAEERDIEAMDTALLGGDAEVYKGPFQPPKGSELMAIVVSVALVGLLAVVACCTTVYDWIL